jgi:Rrf2 family transcriptional regulator, iron-sulfur cluster assembly transcription factor
MLSITSQYALRALSHLARQPGEIVLGRDLAQSVDIPSNYLSKVLLTLRKAGLVDTIRGAGGGYRLNRPATGIYLIEVVELFEEVSRTKPSCFLGRTRPCSETRPCTAHSAWKGLQAAYLGFLVTTPLSEIAGSPGDLWPRSEPPAGSAELSDESCDHNGGIQE